MIALLLTSALLFKPACPFCHKELNPKKEQAIFIGTRATFNDDLSTSGKRTPMEYSVVIPIKNEAENIEPLVNEVESTMGSIGDPWELIYIDDGSTDKSLETILSLKAKKPFLKVISFKKNAGQTSAFDAGFKMAKGKYVITLDGDGQNDPKDIVKMIPFASEFPLVCGKRMKRNDPLYKKLSSKIANSVRGSVLGDQSSDTGCSLKIYQKSALESIKLFTGMHRFLPALFVIEGLPVKQVEVSHRARVKGTSKYHFFNRLVGPIIDLFAVSWMKNRRLTYQINEDISD